MTRRVREPVEQNERAGAAMDDEPLGVVAVPGGAENAARLLVLGLDVLEAPRGPKLLDHAAERSR